MAKKREAKPVVLYQAQLQDDGTVGFYEEKFLDETDSFFVRKDGWYMAGQKKVKKDHVLRHQYRTKEEALISAMEEQRVQIELYQEQLKESKDFLKLVTTKLREIQSSLVPG